MATRQLTPEQRERKRIRTKEWYAKKGREWHAQWRDRNPDKVQAIQERYNAAHAGRKRELGRKRYWADPEKFRQKQKDWIERQKVENPERIAAIRQRNSAYLKAHREELNVRRNQQYSEDAALRFRAKVRARYYQMVRRRRIPAWADLDAIAAVYAECAEMNAFFEEDYHVDHDIPLQGELVSGLHVAENLQILSAAENLRKNNKFDPNA